MIVVRLRGEGGLRPEIRATLESLRLHRKYNAVLVPNRPEIVGMLRKAKDTITWGEASEQAVRLLLRDRGRTVGDRRLTDDVIKERFHAEDLDALVKAIVEREIELEKLYGQGLKAVFRLRPPKRGFKGSIKRPYGRGGELGYRGAAILDLIKHMA